MKEQEEQANGSRSHARADGMNGPASRLRSGENGVEPVTE